MKHPDEPSGEETAVVNQPSSEPGEPSNEPTEEPSSEMSDLTIGFGEIHFRQIACPACVGEPGEFDISAELKLHQPTSGDYLEYLTPVGTCTTNLYNTHVSSQALDASQPAYFNDISLSPSGLGIWANLNFYEYQYSRNTSYDVVSEHGLIENAFETIQGFDSIEPYTLLWVDPSYAFDAIISKSSTSFTWSPVIPNTQFEIIIAVYSPDGSQFLGSVSCLEEDVGYMTIPGSYFQGYPSWSLVAVHLFRHRSDLREAPEFNGMFQSHMIWEVVGTAHIE
jgi:hypothetical protein